MNNVTLSYFPDDFERKKELYDQSYSMYVFENRKVEVHEGVRYELVPGILDHSRKCINKFYGYEELDCLNPISTESKKQLADNILASRKQVLDKDICNMLINMAKKDPFSYTEDDVVVTANSIGCNKKLVKNIIRIILSFYEAQIHSYFQSNFIPVCFSCWETKGVSDTDSITNCSYKWHVDGTPSHYLKVIVYLTDFDDGMGTTEIYGGDMSELSDHLGYSMCPIPRRVTNMRPLLSSDGKYKEPISLNYSAGSAILFDPNFSLHKGVAPRLGFSRFALQVGFVPFSLNYHEIEENIVNILANSRSIAFPVVLNNIRAA